MALNLVESEAKLARARKHLKTLEAEILASVQENKPYNFRCDDADQNGWLTIFVQIKPLLKLDLGVTVGDIVHNLRCALDYIVTQLVRASGIELTKDHYFPIFTNKGLYEKIVGTREAAHKERSPLAGITVGLREIWDVQPFHRNAEASDDSLAIVHLFSNSDKHRLVSRTIAPPSDIEPGGLNRRVLQAVPCTGGTPKAPDYEVPFLRVKIEPPYTGVQYAPGVHIWVIFATQRAIGDKRVRVIGTQHLHAACKDIATVIERFKAL